MADIDNCSSSPTSTSNSLAQSRLVLMKESPTDGRYVVANAPIPAGTLVHASYAYAFAVCRTAALGRAGGRKIEGDGRRCRCCFKVILAADLSHKDENDHIDKKGEQSVDAELRTPPTNTDTDSACGETFGCNVCGVVKYCSRQCMDIFHETYHCNDGLAASRLGTDDKPIIGTDCLVHFLLYGADAAASAISKEEKGAKNRKKGFSTTLSLLFPPSVANGPMAEAYESRLGLMLGLLRRAEMEARSDLKSMLSNAANGARPQQEDSNPGISHQKTQQQQAAAWLTREISPPLCKGAAEMPSFGTMTIDEALSENDKQQRMLNQESDAALIAAALGSMDDTDDMGMGLDFNAPPPPPMCSRENSDAPSSSPCGSHSDIPFEARFILEKQKALGVAEVADPVYCHVGKSSPHDANSLVDGCPAADVDRLISSRLRDAFSAVSDFKRRDGTDQQSDDSSVPDAANLNVTAAAKWIEECEGMATGLPSTALHCLINRKQREIPTPTLCGETGIEKNPQKNFINAIVPRWIDIAALVSNYSVISARVKEECSMVFKAYQKLRKFPPVADAKRNNKHQHSGDLATPQPSFNEHPYFLPDVSESLFISILCAVHCNAFGIYSPAVHGTASVAAAVFPFASYFNHACNPNLCRVSVGMEVRFYALRNIEEGEWLTISYIDGITITTAQRREKLLKSYRFFCRCSRCEGETSALTTDDKPYKNEVSLCDCDEHGFLRTLVSSPPTDVQQSLLAPTSNETGIDDVVFMQCATCGKLVAGWTQEGKTII